MSNYTLAIEDFEFASKKAFGAIGGTRRLLKLMHDRLDSGDNAIDVSLLIWSRELAITAQFLHWPLMEHKVTLAAVRIGHDCRVGPFTYPSAHQTAGAICVETLRTAHYVFIPADGEENVLYYRNPRRTAKRFLDTFDYDLASNSALSKIDFENLPTRIEEMFFTEGNPLLECDLSELLSMVTRERAVVIEDICKNDRLVLSKHTNETSVFWLCAKDAYLALQSLRWVLPYGKTGTQDFSQTYSSPLQEFIDSARRALDSANKEIVPQDKVVMWLEMRLGLAEKLMKEAGPTIEARSSWFMTEVDDRDGEIATWIDSYLEDPELFSLTSKFVMGQTLRADVAGGEEENDIVDHDAFEKLEKKVDAIEKQTKKKPNKKEREREVKLKFIRSRVEKKTWPEIANDWREKPPLKWKPKNLAGAMRLCWKHYIDKQTDKTDK